MRLSDHFTLEEFISSSKADDLGINNTPNQIHIACMGLLCENILEPLSKHFNAPIGILSGFRNLDLNKAIGGSSTSQHMLGEAADIHVKGVRNDEAWRFIEMNLNFDQLIAEKLHKDDGNAGWVHVSYRRVGKQRNEAISFLGDGKYVSGLIYVG